MKLFRHPLCAALTLALAVLPGMLPHLHGGTSAFPGGEELRSHECGDRERHLPLDEGRVCPICRHADTRGALVSDGLQTGAPVRLTILLLSLGSPFPRQLDNRPSADRAPPALS
jgi:hypothetical protein